MALSNILNSSNPGWLSCKYKISVEIIYSDGVIRKLNTAQIIGLYMEKDYDNDVLPIMMLDLSLNKLDKNKIDDQTIFHIKMTQYYLEEDNLNNEKKNSKIYLDEKLVRLEYGRPPDVTEKMEKKLRASDGLSDDDLGTYDFTTKYTFVLVKKSDILMSKVITNAVVSDITMQDLVTWLLTYVDCEKKVLMSSFTNTETHEELLLQPKTFVEQMKFLENEFGWHKEGTYIFIDYNVFYIIRKNGKPTAWVKNEPKQVYFCISSTNSTDEGSNGIITKDNIIYVNVGSNDYSFKDSSIIDDQTYGANIILINTTTGESIMDKSGASTLGETGTYTTKMYHGHNPYVLDQFKRERKENDHVWDVICNNTDLSFYTPQRQFGFISDVTSVSDELMGIYRISSMHTTFIKSGEYFNNICNVRVKRTSLT